MFKDCLRLLVQILLHSALQRKFELTRGVLENYMGRFNDMKTTLRRRSAGVASAIFFGSCAAALAVSSAVNMSTRMMVSTGDNVLIAGFIVNGTGQKQICVRAIGPSLPLLGALQDPVLELHNSSGALVATNDNWRSSQQSALIAAHMNPTNDRESALIVSVQGGSSYTAIVRGTGNTTGVALVEAYDLTSGNVTTRLANISTRGKVLTTDNVMIAGFIVLGDSPKRIIMRVRGPSLVVNGTKIPGALADPALELHDGRGALIAQNDNWQSTQSAQIIATGLQPSDAREPAILSTLQARRLYRDCARCKEHNRHLAGRSVRPRSSAKTQWLDIVHRAIARADPGCAGFRHSHTAFIG